MHDSAETWVRWPRSSRWHVIRTPGSGRKTRCGRITPHPSMGGEFKDAANLGRLDIRCADCVRSLALEARNDQARNRGGA
jgi:hypothetical protein